MYRSVTRHAGHVGASGWRSRATTTTSFHSFAVGDGRITRIDAIRNPEKLRRL